MNEGMAADPFEDDDALFGSLSIEELQKIDRSIAHAKDTTSNNDTGTAHGANIGINGLSFRLTGENSILREHLSKVFSSEFISNRP